MGGDPARKERTMIMVREVMTCKPGKVRQMVENFKAVNEAMADMGHEPFRILTDVSGEQFWTLVVQREHETLGDYREMEREVMADDRFKSAMAGYHDLVVAGRREIFQVEA